MGIYTDGNVYGVYMSIFNDEGDFIVLLDKKYDSKMTIEQVLEVKMEYDKLSEDIKKEVRIQFHVLCTTSYELVNDNKPFMSLWPGSRAMLEELFEKGDIRI